MLSGPIPVPYLEVLWDDAENDPSWDTELETDHKDTLRLVLTVGFLVKETASAIYISHSLSPASDGMLHWNGCLRIPKGMIKQQKQLQ
jgi:hypothetical protein